MTTPTTADLLKYADLQMAAETLHVRKYRKAIPSPHKYARSSPLKLPPKPTRRDSCLQEHSPMLLLSVPRYFVAPVFPF